MKKMKMKMDLQFFAMKSLDLIQEERNVILQRMNSAITEDNPEQFNQAFKDLANNVQEAVMQEYEQAVQGADSCILAQRGVRQLTSQENTYYQKVIDAMKSVDPKQAITLIDDVMPTTVIDEIFTYLQENHPLLNEVDFQNTGAVTKWLLSATSGTAGWGELCGEIVDELSATFSILELGSTKLSAYIPVCNAMLDLGPAWLDRYVRTVLAEAIAVGLETAIVDGDGNEKPLGMTRALSGAVDGVHPHKTAVAITKLDAPTYGGLLDTLSKAPNNKRRPIPSVLLVVNPTDYFTKVFPATTVRATDGTFRSDVFPYPTKTIQSTAVPVGRAVIGLGKQYFMGLGTGKGGKIEHSDHAMFKEDKRLYRAKLYGNGRPKDENAFVYLNIEDLENYVLEVKVTSTSETKQTNEAITNGEGGTSQGEGEPENP